MERRLVIAVVLPVMMNAGWIKTFDHGGVETGRYVHELSDGSLVVAGEVVFEDSTALFLDRFDAGGNLTWSRFHRGHGAGMVIRTEDGGFAVSGGVQGNGAPDSILLIKTHPNGHCQWSKTYGCGEVSGLFPGSCLRQVDDGFSIVGNIFIRTDHRGDTLYTRTYEKYGIPSVFPNSNLTDDGGYVLSRFGVMVGNDRQVKPQHDHYLAKLDSAGNVVWVDSTLNTGMGYPEHVAQGLEGFVGIGGMWHFDTTSDMNFNIVAAEWGGPDEYYEPLWLTEFGEDTVDEYGKYITRASDNCYIATGKPLTLIKLTMMGDVIWTREITGHGQFVQELADGGFIVTGTADYDLLLIKTDSLGYVEAVEEQPGAGSSFDISTSIGSHITLRYKGYPDGFHAEVFDPSGCKVDKIHSPGRSGVVLWGKNTSGGVYFITDTQKRMPVHKVILIK